jgi:hypothetical protein
MRRPSEAIPTAYYAYAVACAGPPASGLHFVTFSKQIGSDVLDSMTKMEAQTRDQIDLK